MFFRIMLGFFRLAKVKLFFLFFFCFESEKVNRLTSKKTTSARGAQLPSYLGTVLGDGRKMKITKKKIYQRKLQKTKKIGTDILCSLYPANCWYNSKKKTKHDGTVVWKISSILGRNILKGLQCRITRKERKKKESY